MECNKILCVGLYDNGLSLLLKLLIKKKLGEAKLLIKSVGINDHAHNEFPVSRATLQIAEELGFMITPQLPTHPSIKREAKGKNMELFHHLPTHISKFRKLELFDEIITPYAMVRNDLVEKLGVDQNKVFLINCPRGISTSVEVTEAYHQMKKWVEFHF